MTSAEYPSFVDELPLTRRALDYAGERHGDQRREADQAPFILHPLEVAHLLRGRGYPDHVVAAGVLHDVIEDTEARSDELAARFGPEVAELVCAVTEPEGPGGYVQRKTRLRAAVAQAHGDALAVFAADKVAKTRELRLMLVRAPDGRAQLDQDRLDHYWGCLAVLERRLGHDPLVRQLRFELEALALLPPGANPPAGA